MVPKPGQLLMWHVALRESLKSGMKMCLMLPIPPHLMQGIMTYWYWALVRGAMANRPKAGWILYPGWK